MNREYIIKGHNLRFGSGLEIKQFSVDEILELGYGYYMYFVKCFMLKPQDLIIELWGQGIYYEDITHDELFMKQIKNDEQLFFQLFKIFTNCEDVWIDYVEDMESDTICFRYNNDNYYMTYEMFDNIYLFFKQVHLFEHSPKRKFIGEKTKKSILDEDYEEYLQELQSSKNDSYLSDMISFIVVSNLREWDSVYKYPIGRLYEEFIKTSKKQQVDYKMFGIYMGTVDTKRISKDALNWHKT